MAGAVLGEIRLGGASVRLSHPPLPVPVRVPAVAVRAVVQARASPSSPPPPTSTPSSPPAAGTTAAELPAPDRADARCRELPAPDRAESSDAPPPCCLRLRISSVEARSSLSTETVGRSTVSTMLPLAAPLSAWHSRPSSGTCACVLRVMPHGRAAARTRATHAPERLVYACTTVLVPSPGGKLPLAPQRIYSTREADVAQTRMVRVNTDMRHVVESDHHVVRLERALSDSVVWSGACMHVRHMRCMCMLCMCCAYVHVCDMCMYM